MRRLVGAVLAILLVAVAYGAQPTPGPPPWADELSPSVWNTLPPTVQEDSTRFDAALRILDPQGALAAVLTRTSEGVAVRHPSRQQALELPFVAAGIGARPAFRRILLDPGHRGGPWARIEERDHGADLGPAIREGDLTYVTARLIQVDLEKRGFEVRLTRAGPPAAPYPEGAFPGFDPEREIRWWLFQRRPSEASSLSPLGRSRFVRWWLERVGRRRHEANEFLLYNQFELRARSEIAEHFEPDLTLSLHYNASPDPEDDGIVLYVPGNPLVGELDAGSERFFAVRRLLEGSLWPSIEVARRIGHAMQQQLSLPALGVTEERSLRSLAVDEAAGVYARNLAILRRTPGPVVLIEGPCVSHPDEAILLTQSTGEIDGLNVPERSRQYAAAIVHALVASPRAPQPSRAD